MSRKRKNKMNEQVQNTDPTAVPQPPVKLDEHGNPIVTEEFTQTEEHTGETPQAPTVQ